MTALVTASHLTKTYGSQLALDRVSFTIGAGRIVGLVGPNGAGKTTAVRAILGLTRCRGQISVFGRDPFRERAQVMREACFIADVAVMPSWLKVGQAVDFVAGVHGRFRRERAQTLLAAAQVTSGQRLGDLSKGVKTQVHLALAMAIDARLLVLDEPTLGLDPIARRGFYDALLNDYMDEQRTIIVTTNQVEEVENLLTDVIFIQKGRVILESTLESIGERYAAVEVPTERLDGARAMRPFYERQTLGKTVLYFENIPAEALAGLGEVHTPGIADLLVAKLSEQRS